ncbi:MAG: hypothetical protein V3U35_06965 [Candidatus Neomarinimicrobiota bacterium]
MSARVAHRAAQEQLTILALRVAFTPDDNLSTTGTGQFLTGLDTLRCPAPAFLVDPTPHDAAYFQSQLKAVANYYDQVTRVQAGINLGGSLVFPPEGQDPLVVGPMASYRPVVDDDSSDALLVKLYAESLQAAQEAKANVWDYDVVVVFHAGLGQDFNYPTLDPTPLDIPSANIDLTMIEAALETRGIPLPPATALFEAPGILLPEGQNHIYYDIVEDIFPGALNFCDLQTGLTGTFALLMGFVLGLPPLFDLDDGETGVGVFGLMDVGSNNGQGVVPAPPTAWTRLHMRWETAVELAGAEALPARHLIDRQVGRVTLSLDEYFLVENRSNWLPGLPGVDVDSLRFRNREPAGDGEGFIIPNYFDYLVDSAGLTVDTATGVITAVPNYDLGLPGSGLLIWHVDESRIPGDLQGLNNDPNARAVALEEADGAVDIGFPSTAIFADPTQGWRWDLWYAGNPAWFEANPESFRLAGNPQRLLALDRESRPSSHLNSGAESGVALTGIGPAADTQEFSVVTETDVTRLPEGSRLLGFNGERWVYALRDSLWLDEHPFAEQYSDNILVVSGHDPVLGPASNTIWVVEQGASFSYVARRFNDNGDMTTPELGDSLLHSKAYYDNGQLFLGVQENLPLPEPPDATLVGYFSTIRSRQTLTVGVTFLKYMIWSRLPRPGPPAMIRAAQSEFTGLSLIGYPLATWMEMAWMRSLRPHQAKWLRLRDARRLKMETGSCWMVFPYGAIFKAPHSSPTSWMISAPSWWRFSMAISPSTAPQASCRCAWGCTPTPPTSSSCTCQATPWDWPMATASTGSIPLSRTPSGSPPMAATPAAASP